MRFVRPCIGRLSDFFSSIRFRLTLWFVVMLAVVLTVFSIFIYASQSRDLRTDAVQEMQAKLGRLRDYFASEAWQNSNISPADIPDARGQTLLEPNDFVLLVTSDGQVAQQWGASPQDPAQVAHSLLSTAQQNRGFTVYQQSVSVANDSSQSRMASYLFIVVPVLRHDSVLGFLILGSPSVLELQLQRLRVSLLLGSLGMLAIAFLGGLWLADRAMHPVRSITQTARVISESDLNRRINLQGRDELAQLAGTFDNMLARLQKAFERQRRFVADASHELRTPLTIINLEVGRVLSGKRKPAEYQHALEVVDLESTRMTRLVNDLMTLARMDAGQTVLEHADLDLSEVAVEAYERMLPLAAHRQIMLDIGDMQELPVRGDRQYLVQMVSSLIENAIKYSPPGAHVALDTALDSAEPQPTAVLHVSDTGPGIPPEHLAHLFERFYRADAARTRDAQDDSSSPAGTGLGLSIVDWIVRGHGGRIDVVSQLDKGTTFEVRLPLRTA